MKGAKIQDDFFKDKIDYCGLEDNIYNQLSRTMARSVDIDFVKTPIIDILTGYIRYIEAEKKVEQLENIKKEVIEFIEQKIKNKNFDYIKFSMDEIVCLLNIFNKGSEQDAV